MSVNTVPNGPIPTGVLTREFLADGFLKLPIGTVIRASWKNTSSTAKQPMNDYHVVFIGGDGGAADTG